MKLNVWCLSPILFLLLTVPLSSATAQDAATEARIKKIERQVVAPCCWRQTVDEHQSGAADKVKAAIREQVAAGKTDKEILDGLVAEHGMAILAVPRFQGFNRLLIVGVIAVVLYGVYMVVRVLRRWRRTTAAAEGGAPPVPPLDPAYARKIEEELKEDI